MKRRLVKLFLALAAIGMVFGSFNEKVKAAALSSLPAGTVIKIGGRPWVWIGSTTQTGTKAGYGYIMAMSSYIVNAWGSNDTDPSTAISTTSDTGAIYTSLPATIGGIAKATALASNTWQWDTCPHGGTNVCTNTTTSTSRLSLVSFYEWQGGAVHAYSEPVSGSVGNIFCRAWKGTPCLGTSINGNFNAPWTRSGASYYEATWHLAGGTNSLGVYHPLNTRDHLPVAWLLSSITTEASTVFANRGSGTYADPYCLTGECNTAPTVTTAAAAQTANNGSNSIAMSNGYVRNGNKLYISGTITDPDAQNFTVSYSLSSNTTPGAWTVCRSASSTSTHSGACGATILLT